MMRSIQLAVIFAVFSCINSAPSSTFVSLKVRHISKRSTDGEDSFVVNINGDGHDYSLPLKPPETSVFSKNFQYNVAKEDNNGQVVFVDETPSKASLKAIEDQIFVHQESGSALSISKPDSGNGFAVQGITNNFAILPNEKQQYHLVALKSSGADSSVNDYIDLHRNLTPSAISTRAAVSAQPEIWVIFDYANSAAFGQDRNKILDYLGVFFHAINNRYATIGDPAISFRISGVTAISTRTGQPFMENNKVPDGSGNDINKVLEDFSKWAYTNQGSFKFDMAAVISGADMQSKDSNGAYAKSIAGLAYVSAACWKTTDRWYATSVTEDIGGYYDGLWSVAHEFAHNLGAPHDGSDGAASCSWDDGYIMSYLGWGTTNKFYFSPCSINLMRNYISTNQGSCVKSQQSSTTIPISSDNVGDRFSMTQLCVKYTGQSKAVPEPTKTADELCKNLSCRYPTPGKPEGWYSITTLNHPPGDNSACGTGGKCINGNCVTNTG